MAPSGTVDHHRTTNWLSTPLIVIFAVITALPFGVLVQRMIGLRLGPVRLVLAGVFAMIVSAPIATNFARIDVPATGDGRVGWFLPLSVLCTVLATMLFLVVTEAFVPYGSIPLSRIWGRGLRGRLARSRRLVQVVGIIWRRRLGPYLGGRRRRALRTPNGRAEFGRALTAALNDAGVTFVKFGQIIATRRDCLPAEVADELSSLQDDAAPVPWPDIEAVLTGELGGPIDAHFRTFDREPLGVASVGQVHAGTLHTGEEVVVKVQRPGIRENVERDLDIAYRLASRLDQGTGRLGSFAAADLVDGMAAALREELDYRVEAANLAAVAATETYRRATDIRIPTVRTEMSTARILVMQRLVGQKLSASTAGADLRDELAHRLLSFLMHEVAVDGPFHADPHPGNVLILDHDTIGLIDFGSVGRLDSQMRYSLQRLLFGVDRADSAVVTDALMDMVGANTELDEVGLERDIGRFLAKHVVGGAAQQGQVFTELFRIMADHRLSVPQEVATVVRALGTVEGTLRELVPEFDLIPGVRAVASDLLGQKVSPTALKAEAIDRLAELLPVLRKLPRRVDRILAAAEHGQLGIRVSLHTDSRDGGVITDLVNRILVAFLAAASGIMAVLLLSADGGPRVTPSVSLFALIGYNLLVLAAILALRAIAPVFRRGNR